MFTPCTCWRDVSMFRCFIKASSPKTARPGEERFVLYLFFCVFTIQSLVVLL